MTKSIAAFAVVMVASAYAGMLGGLHLNHVAQRAAMERDFAAWRQRELAALDAYLARNDERSAALQRQSSEMVRQMTAEFTRSVATVLAQSAPK